MLNCFFLFEEFLNSTGKAGYLTGTVGPVQLRNMKTTVIFG